MQANQIAHLKVADKQTAANSISFMQYGKSQNESAFAQLFAQMQSREYGGGTGYMSIFGNNSSGQYVADRNIFPQNQSNTFQNSQTDLTNGNASYADQNYDRSPNIPVDQSVNDTARERTDNESAASGAYLEQDSKTLKSNDQESIAEEQKLDETELKQLNGPGSAKQAEDERAALASLIEMLQSMLAQKPQQAGQKQTFNLDQGKKQELTAILEGLKGKSEVSETAASLKNLAEFLRTNQDMLKEHAAQGKSKSEGSTLADLKKLLIQLDPDASAEMKKGRLSQRSGQIETNAKSREDLSFLESARSTFQGRNLTAEHRGTMADTNTGSAVTNQKSVSGIPLGKTDSFAAEIRAAHSNKNAAEGLGQISKEGVNGKDILDNKMNGISSNLHSMRNNAASQGAAKAEANQTDQETAIKNFRDVKALLDKQIMQVKETSTSSMTIKLNPQELGKINIQLELLDNGKLQGKIFVENEITKNNLQQYAEIMKDQIKAQGITLDKFEINLGSGEMEQSFQDFQQQGRYGGQPERSQSRQSADFKYDEELSNQLKSALQPENTLVGKLNTLA